jgi:hypothetical protein
VTLRYFTALLRAAPPSDLLRAVLYRLRPPPRRPIPPGPAEIAAAERALAQAPRLFTADDVVLLYRAHFPDVREERRRRAERILDGEAEIFGEWRRPDPDHADPKLAWEAARAGHLVELGAGARLHPSLAAAARARVVQEIEDNLDRSLPPLEVTLRGLHWLAALELVGGVPEALRPRLARSLLMEARILSTHLEDGGVCPANHLLGDWLGLLMRGVFLGRHRWEAQALAGVRREAARQVNPDGAHFEASTAYHRFALELIWVAHRMAGGFEGLLRRMLDFVRGYLLPDRSEPGFGDGDDARLLPVVPRAPRDHGYLLGLGAALLGEPRLAEMPEEVVWWGGQRAVAAWRTAPLATPSPAASFTGGGVHVLRSPRLYMAMRAGSYGQHGVGGHAHNDQLSLVVHAGGRPLIVDPGTGSYTADPVARQRFRGTAAHSTVVVGGGEQSPLFEERPFALPDRARGELISLEDLETVASIYAQHHGYRPLRHRRRVTLYRELDALLIEDELDGRGQIPVEVRFHLAREAAPAGERTRERVAWLAGRLGVLAAEDGVELAGAALVPLVGNPLRPRFSVGWVAPHFGRILQAGVVSFGGLLSLPQTVAVAVLVIPTRP